MAKTRTLPDKYYDKDYETNGIQLYHGYAYLGRRN